MTTLRLSPGFLMAVGLCLCWHSSAGQRTEAPVSPGAGEVRPADQSRLRLLLVAGGPNREYQLLRLLLARAKKRFEVTIDLQTKPAAEVDSGPEPPLYLKRFPDHLGDPKKDKPDDRPYNLEAYDVVVAVDADWSTLKPKQLATLRQWVRAHGGGLIVVAGPVLAGGAEADTQAKKNASQLKALEALNLLPVVLKGTKLGDPATGQPWRLEFPEVKNRPAFLQLEEGKGPLGGWAEFFDDGLGVDKRPAEPVRGLYRCYPVQSVRPGATVLATFSDPKVRLPDGKPGPFLVTSRADKGRVVYLGWTDMWRLRAYKKKDFHKRFWAQLIDHAAGPAETVHPNQTLVQGRPSECNTVFGRHLNQGQHGDYEEDFLAARDRYYVQPRAYPGTKINHQVRFQAQAQLGALRLALNRPHVKTGWRDQAVRTPTSPAGGPALGPCAWVSVGPTNVNGRITGIAIDPRNKQNLFVTTVGGVWRSRDGARRWQRVSDSFVSGVCACVALNPRNSNEICVGTGDPNYATYNYNRWGKGIWRSTTGGDPGSWVKVTPAELDNQTIFRLRIDPDAPNNVYAATSAGLYLGTRTDTGFTWARLKDFNAWTTDFVVDFTATPRKVYAGVAQASTTFGIGVWKFDGSSWQKRDTGVPMTDARTFALALAASDPKILYAKVENGKNGKLLGVYKTTTAAEAPVGGGNAWTNLPGGAVMDDSQYGNGFGYSWYNSLVEVDPTNANTVYGVGVSIFRSTDGGTTWKSMTRGADDNYRLATHGDNHALAFDPDNSKTIYLGTDGGLYRAADTFDATWSWRNVSHGLVLTEFYHITTQQAAATILAGGTQDNGTVVTFGNRTWYNPYGCDGADVALDAGNSLTMYLNCGGGLHELANPIPGTPGSGTEVKWVPPAGFQVSPPVVTDPARASAALAAGTPANRPDGQQRLLKTTNGVNWVVASADFPAQAPVSFIAIAPSSSFQTYYVGLAGNPPAIRRTTDGGANWSTTTTGLPTNLRPNGAAVDYTDPKRAVAVFGGQTGGGVYLTTDGGATWKSLAGSGANAYPGKAVATGVVIDPFDANIVYVASHIGVFKGQITPGAAPTAAWVPFDEGLVDGLDVTDICVNRVAGLLTIGTMGHGAYQRDIRPGAKCPAVKLVVRDNVFDRGQTPSTPAQGYPDPEHPVADPARPGFYKPGDPVFWWASPDIRIDVPALDSFANKIVSADHVEFETTPIRIAPALPGTLMDSNPVRGQFARVYVQVNNRGLQPASNVRVVALWANATAGLPPLPADFWTKTFPAGSSTCGPLNPASGWHFVDPRNPCRVIPVVNPAVPEVAGFDWDVPTQLADHSCMLVLVDSADDPIEPALRTANETRPWVFVPNSRHIGQRNLHVVTVTNPRQAQPHLVVVNVPNPHPTRHTVELHVSRGTLRAGGTVGLVLPKAEFKTKGLKSGPGKLSDEHKALAAKWQLDHGTVHVLHERDGHIKQLPVPAGTTGKIGILLQRSPDARAGSSAHITIITRDGTTVLGGSTFILRTPAR